MDGTTIWVAGILFLASFIRSAFGFGEALVAVPLLCLLIPVEVATPLAVLASVTVAALVVAQDWRHVHPRSAAWLVLSTLLGMPLGFLLLVMVPGRIVKAALAFVILAFSSHSLLSHKPQASLKDDKSAWAFGFVAGILGGAYGMNGPPLVIYGALRGWSPQHFRATLQGYFFPASLAGMVGYWLLGLWTPAVTGYYLMSLPAVVAAVLLGRLANKRMTGPAFLRYVHAGLLVVGAMLLFQAVAGTDRGEAGGPPSGSARRL